MKKQIIGLALSGGGHKGAMHAGVLKFLNEQHIDIKVISGASSGALLGCLHAIGQTPEEMVDFLRQTELNFSNFSLSRNGLFSSDKFMAYLDKVFGNQSIGDLPKEMYISATNMETGKTKIFSRHILIKEALSASCAFPAIFPPVKVEGHLYSDGGILNNFPVNIIQGRCDFLIGINLDNGTSFKSADEFTYLPQVAWRAIDIMMGQNASIQNHLCDWLINPNELNRFNTFESDINRLDEIFQFGYDTAQSQFELIKPLLEESA